VVTDGNGTCPRPLLPEWAYIHGAAALYAPGAQMPVELELRSSPFIQRYHEGLEVHGVRAAEPNWDGS